MLGLFLLCVVFSTSYHQEPSPGYIIALEKTGKASLLDFLETCFYLLWLNWSISPLLSVMSASARKNELNSLLKQLNDQVAAFNARHAESDRLATIQMARDLIQKLQTPQESVTNNYLFSIFVLVGVSSQWLVAACSPLISCASELESILMFSTLWRAETALCPWRKWPQLEAQTLSWLVCNGSIHCSFSAC